MFQLVLCSTAPLPLGTLVQATHYSLDLYLHGQAPAESRSEDIISFALAQRWLMSRSGGLLETYTASVEEDGELGASEQYVQFIHQTTNEYVQSPRAQGVMENLAALVAEKNGFYFLALCSKSCSSWVAPIKIHMLHYTKLVEFHDGVDNRIDPLGALASTTSADLPCDLAWWLAQRKESFFATHRKYFRGRGAGSVSPVSNQGLYLRLSIMVATNLIFMVERHFSPGLLAGISNADRRSMCLLEVAIYRLDIVPANLQDRAAMVSELLSIDYP